MRARMLWKRLLLYTLTLGLLAVMVFSGTQVVRYLLEGRAQARLDEEWAQYRPTLPPSTAETSPEAPTVVNPGVVDAQAANPDVVGWLTVPGTAVDYPFVLGADNGYYLTHNVAREEARAGALFLDSRTDRGFFASGYAGGQGNAILYGHQMKNGSMFADVRKFRERAYFDAHAEGYIFLADGNRRVRFFAFLTADAYDAQLYGIWEDAAAYKAYVESRAGFTRAVELPPGGRILALSTCTNEFETARALLVGVVEEA